MSDKLLGGYLVRLANIVSEMKTTGSTSLHVTDRQTREKLDVLINEIITAMEPKTTSRWSGRRGMSDKTDRPPFRELMTIMENIGYEVISISAEDIGALNLGAINLRIIPKAWLSDSAFNYFPPVRQDSLSGLCECSSQSVQ